MTEEEIRIAIGKNPADGKWYAVLTLPNGKQRSTEAYDTQEQCKTAVDEYLRSQKVQHNWQRTQ